MSDAIETCEVCGEPYGECEGPAGCEECGRLHCPRCASETPDVCVDCD